MRGINSQSSPTCHVLIVIPRLKATHDVKIKHTRVYAILALSCHHGTCNIYNNGNGSSHKRIMGLYHFSEAHFLANFTVIPGETGKLDPV